MIAPELDFFIKEPKPSHAAIATPIGIVQPIMICEYIDNLPGFTL